MYSRKDYLESDDCWHNSEARARSGLDWNYYIAPKIDRDLHERLLPFSAEQMLPFASILPLIRSGYLCTAKSLVEASEVPETLAETKRWLIDALSEADDTQGEG